ncbi:MAG: PqqD family protein [Epsilonproteobacteria bacterium]|nr:PqqD family protein [Campylobacterota bacterium]
MLHQIIIDENNMGFIPSIGASFQMNETAREIINHIQQGLHKDDIIQALVAKYGISQQEALIDVNDFFMKLKIYGLIQ